MCGIIGLFDKESLSSHRFGLKDAHRIIEYRGPDGEGMVLLNPYHPERRFITYQSDCLPDDSVFGTMTLALGHRRLAIIDLTHSGKQPMSSEDGLLWITYNGEIFNYIELCSELQKEGHFFHSSSDTEVILHAYEAWGEDCVQHFNGMWAFAIADFKNQKLFCSRDRFGVKPFYYYFDGLRFAFGSEIKQLLCFPFVPRRINQRAIYDYLIRAATDHDEDTCFTGIHKLLQGHNLNLDLSKVTLNVHRYYSPSFKINHHITHIEAAQEFRRLLTDSVRLCLRSDVKVGTCLSGGLDSSAIVCIMQQLLDEKWKKDQQYTFSSHFVDKEANEIDYMQTVIDATGVNAHFTYPTDEELVREIDHLVWHQDEPFGSTSIFAQWSLFKNVHQHSVKVMLDGQGADEQLAGYIPLIYWFFDELFAKRKYPHFIWESFRYLCFHPDDRARLIKHHTNLFKTVTVGLFKKRSETNPHSTAPPGWMEPGLAERYCKNGRYGGAIQEKPYGNIEYLNNTLYRLTFHGNLQSLLRYEDRNSMAFSVEGRVPFLDYRLVEFISSLPSHFKIRHGYTKSVLRDAMKGILPEKIRLRKSKLGFATPERKWQETTLRPLILNAIESERMRDFLIPNRARDYLYETGKGKDVNFLPWRWLNLSLWLKAYNL